MAVVVEAGGEIDVLDDDLAVVINAVVIIIALIRIAGEGGASALDEVESLCR